MKIIIYDLSHYNMKKNTENNIIVRTKKYIKEEKQDKLPKKVCSLSAKLKLLAVFSLLKSLTITKSRRNTITDYYYDYKMQVIRIARYCEIIAAFISLS